jgi:hypothetical protein
MWNPQCGGQEGFLMVSTKTSQALCSSISQETPLTLDEATSLSELHLPSCGRVFIMWMQNTPHWEKGDVIPGFCVPNFNKPHKHTH